MNDRQKEKKREESYKAVEIPQRHMEEIRHYEHRIGVDGNRSSSSVPAEYRQQANSDSNGAR